MIRISELTLQRGPLRLLENADLTLHPGHKVGLIGANGAGKSSLFALLRGELHPDAGDCLLPMNWRIAHMRQEIDAPDRDAIDYVLDGDSHLRDIQQQLAKAEQRQDGVELGRLYSELDNADAYTSDARARKLLAGLGFLEEQMENQVNSFSGGWRMRLNLAQALMCPSDLLLLDEPTNHLDLDAILWLEGWLQNYSGTLLLISHDRDFLDAVVGHIVHINQQKLTLYRGGYTAFERACAERIMQQQQAHEKQSAQRAHMEDFIRRFKAKASKARQAQSRVKALERMEELAPAHFDSPFDFIFREADKVSTPLLNLDEAALGYHAEQPILSNVKLQLVPGARIALLGPNGAGKSTLIKSIMGDLPLLAGQLTCSENLVIGYFAQHQLDSLDPKASPLLHFQRIAQDEREQVLRNFLGGFNFRGKRCDEPVLNFSGGEKARLALALIAWGKPNLLLLDEPTNHLDLEMRQALSMALQDFSGALLLVSHDRHLIKSTMDELYLVAEGRVQEFAGDLEDYSKWLSDYRLRQHPNSDAGTSPDKVDRRAQRQAAAALRKQLAPLRKHTDTLEKQLDNIQKELQALETILTDNNLYEPPQKEQLKQHLNQQTNLLQQQVKLEETWLNNLEELELLQSELEEDA
ncbi:ATP-binding cassette, subfamily F, member 3 [Nitrosomonas eutropha]|uniref:ABC-F family ATP-binding cassette domain-containing protein n=1 Tax=Nitrosomonas eutropha TaxID=916 RepID=UPI0008839F18|nr:ATP-binding cassette domain-containing protein [Nitrosomonas eutropha]SCX12663.1 ATP-binding cassette, subfamily F, member 3 [Nitrosomonas eutropha]